MYLQTQSSDLQIRNSNMDDVCTGPCSDSSVCLAGSILLRTLRLLGGGDEELARGPVLCAPPNSMEGSFGHILHTRFKVAPLVPTQSGLL